MPAFLSQDAQDDLNTMAHLLLAALGVIVQGLSYLWIWQATTGAPRTAFTHIHGLFSYWGVAAAVLLAIIVVVNLAVPAPRR